MNDEKKIIVDSFRKIYSTATTTASDPKIADNDYFKRRLGGFGAENEFPQLLKKISNISFFEGGQFISKKLQNDRVIDKNEFIYTTLDNEDSDRYKKIYSEISKWKSVSSCFYIKIVFDNWSMENFSIKDHNKKFIKTEILKPQFEFYLFDKKELKFKKLENNNFEIILNYFDPVEKKPATYQIRGEEKFSFLNAYETNQLKKVYATRYFIDYILRKIKKNIIDVDGFVVKNEKTLIVEIKEKFPIKPKSNFDDQKKWSYGWDTRRLLWYHYLATKLGIDVLYAIKQVTSRENRKLLQWDCILLKDFLKGVSWSYSRGGGGGEDTLSVPYLQFKRLESYLENF